jgi:hypothetical protein
VKRFGIKHRIIFFKEAHTMISLSSLLNCSVFQQNRQDATCLDPCLPTEKIKTLREEKQAASCLYLLTSGAKPTETFGYLHQVSFYDGKERRPLNLHTKRGR